ncbi:conserved hypothetical protein [Caldicellulosiruptor hydrothermalis 108]|uniref:Regulatory protein YycH-like domain-containing protein n=1 Tax=Caldicellulosiruptor hydrothermalis (strain DSM 18901 / VKM B-2411 / 108) TaxID=632292 RepID=E4QA81_CALH1|nr:hypothetical protein [Caldicellulosiruptor hydrothermalis]ADQ07053.1 conserved hypothetical protein [Caldicellulosiruptor hydrothermalis 108]
MTMRKNIKIYLLSFLTILIIFAISFVLYINSNKIPKLNIPMPGQEIPQIDYKVTAKFDNLPTEAMVYRFKKPQDVDFYSIAKKFGISGDVKYDSENKRYTINDESGRYFEYEVETGKWLYIDFKEKNNYEPQNIPSDEDSKRIAIEFLKKEGLYNERFNYCTVVPEASGDKLTNDYKIHCWDVYFYPSINGKPVYGVSRIMVSVGDNGKIIEVDKLYKDIEEYKKVKIVPAEKALEKVKKRQASNNINPRAKSATINKVFLAYWEDAGTIEEQPYLQPVWVFAGEAVTEDGKYESFDAVVPAIE